MQKLGEELRDPKKTEILQEYQCSQLAWTLVGSHELNHQPKNEPRQDLDLCPYVADAQLVLHADPPTTGIGMSLPTGSNHNCPLRGTTQQLMERDSETHR